MTAKAIAAFKKFCTREIISYLVCGVLTTVLAIVIYGVCVLAGLDVVVSNTVSTAIATVFAYIVNRIFVFQSKANGFMPLLLEFCKFTSGRLITYVLETYLLVLLARLLGESDIMKFSSKVFTTALIVVLNYFISKWIVFRKK